MYEMMWNLIFTYVPALKTSLRTILIDCETAAINAVREKLPLAKVKICLFHVDNVIIIFIFLRIATREKFFLQIHLNGFSSSFVGLLLLCSKKYALNKIFFLLIFETSSPFKIQQFFF